MSREIKYRGLQITNNFIYGFPFIDDKGQMFIVAPSGAYWVTELDEFTGLKDKNGMEIYEGDILKWKDIIVTVKWEQQACAFWMTWKRKRDGKKQSCYEFMNASSGYINNEEAVEYGIESVEVIGNIHQKPELLNN